VGPLASEGQLETVSGYLELAQREQAFFLNGMSVWNVPNVRLHFSAAGL
jgi:hypothetical protein